MNISVDDLFPVVFMPLDQFRDSGSDRITFCRLNARGVLKWAVRRESEGFCLNKSHEMEYEPLPSNRDDDFHARCRFNTLQEAVEAYNGWVVKCMPLPTPPGHSAACKT